VQDARLLLLDEPVAGMSQAEREETGQLLQRIGAQRTVVVVEHDMEFLRSFASSVTVLHQGAVLSEGTVAQVQADVRTEMERRFSPEFLNRVDDVVIFSPLNPDEARRIAAQYLDTVAAAMNRAGKTVSIDADALDRLVSEGHSPAYGARFLKRVIDERVKLPISARWQEGTRYQIAVQDGRVIVEASSPSVMGGEQAVA